VAATVEEAVEQSAFPAVAATVAVAPVAVLAAAAVAANEETGEARVSIHVVPTAASMAAREATEWLVPEASLAELAVAAAVAAAVSVVIRRILQRGIPVATYPAIVHHLRALIT